jgi:histidine phosphotransferase ChpT
MTDRPDHTPPPCAPDLVALVGSRIAHDLASPIGAIANGVELLALTGLDGSPEMALITESVQNASARIKTFRIAFGAAGAGQSVSQAEIRALTAAAADGRKLEIDWQVPGDVARTDAKLAVLALMCLETAMPWGGHASVSREGALWRIAARADRLNIDPCLWAPLDSAAAPGDVAPAQVHFLLLPTEAAAQARSLHVTRTEAGISIEV